MKVEKMNAEKYGQFVANEFERLLRCKRGVLLTEEHARRGDKPNYTNDEKVSILKGSSARIQAEMIGRFSALIKSTDLVAAWDRDLWYIVADEIDLSSFLSDIINEFDLFKHPDIEEWYEVNNKLMEEMNTRVSVMDKQAANLVRDFKTGVKYPKELNKVLEEFEKEEF